MIIFGCTGLAMSFEWREMHWQDGYLLWGSVKVGEQDVLVYVERTKSRKPCHRLVGPTGVGAQEAKAPGRMQSDIR